MSARELLHEIKQLPACDRLWLIEQLLPLARQSAKQAEDTEWRRFSAAQLLAQYAPEDSIYDSD